jgi:hypothetical protein
MSFHRQPAPHVIAHARGRSAIVCRFVSEREIAAVLGDADPFLIGFPCKWSPTGAHVPVRSDSEIVCEHCSVIFEWRF